MSNTTITGVKSVAKNWCSPDGRIGYRPHRHGWRLSSYHPATSQALREYQLFTCSYPTMHAAYQAVHTACLSAGIKPPSIRRKRATRRYRYGDYPYLFVAESDGWSIDPSFNHDNMAGSERVLFYQHIGRTRFATRRAAVHALREWRCEHGFAHQSS